MDRTRKSQKKIRPKSVDFRGPISIRPSVSLVLIQSTGSVARIMCQYIPFPNRAPNQFSTHQEKMHQTGMAVFSQRSLPCFKPSHLVEKKNEKNINFAGGPSHRKLGKDGGCQADCLEKLESSGATHLKKSLEKNSQYCHPPKGECLIPLIFQGRFFPGLLFLGEQWLSHFSFAVSVKKSSTRPVT